MWSKTTDKYTQLLTLCSFNSCLAPLYTLFLSISPAALSNRVRRSLVHSLTLSLFAAVELISESILLLKERDHDFCMIDVRVVFTLQKNLTEMIFFFLFWQLRTLVSINLAATSHHSFVCHSRTNGCVITRSAARIHCWDVKNTDNLTR